MSIQDNKEESKNQKSHFFDNEYIFKTLHFPKRHFNISNKIKTFKLNSTKQITTPKNNRPIVIKLNKSSNTQDICHFNSNYNSCKDLHSNSHFCKKDITSTSDIEYTLPIVIINKKSLSINKTIEEKKRKIRSACHRVSKNIPIKSTKSSFQHIRRSNSIQSRIQISGNQKSNSNFPIVKNKKTPMEEKYTCLLKKSATISTAMIPNITHLSKKILHKKLENFHPSLYSSEYNTNSIIKGFASNGYRGLYSKGNMTKLLIVLNVATPDNIPNDFSWPKLSIFGLYDGHNGSTCAEYLRENLHQNIMKNQQFPKRIEKSFIEGCLLTDKNFLKEKALKSSKNQVYDSSGSCALFAFFNNDEIDIGCVGDSIALLSRNNMSSIEKVSPTHNFRNEAEGRRIIAEGGTFKTIIAKVENYIKFKAPPCYDVVVPGETTATRTFGDVEAKMKRFGGKDNVLIATPDIYTFKLNDEMDFLFFGTSNIFTVMSFNDILQCFKIVLVESDCYNKISGLINQHKVCGKTVDMIIKTAQFRGAIGSIGCIFILLKDYELNGKEMEMLLKND